MNEPIGGIAAQRISYALVLALALAAGSGCAGRQRTDATETFPFTVEFERIAVAAQPATEKARDETRLCPIRATLAEAKRNCSKFLFFGHKEDCANVRRHDAVTFDAAKGSPEFRVHFDPFDRRKRDEAAFRWRGEGPLHFTIDPDAPYKTYVFYVASEGCPPTDPEIIVGR